VRELARRVAQLDKSTGSGGTGETGPQGPPGNGYEPTVFTADTNGEPGVEVALEMDAPAIGALLQVVTVPPSVVEIYGSSTGDTPEVSPVEGGVIPVIPPVLVANRDGVRADKWYLRVTPTEDSWNAVGSSSLPASTVEEDGLGGST